MLALIVIPVARIPSGDAPTPGPPIEEDIQVPEQVETVLEQLFGFLQDRVGCLEVLSTPLTADYSLSVGYCCEIFSRQRHCSDI